jgi:histidinol-phosphatase (PHP family)
MQSLTLAARFSGSRLVVAFIAIERGSVSRIPQDYHLHSHYSRDSRQSIMDVCSRAVELGIAEIAITDHADYIRGDIGANYYEPKGYFADLEKAREAFEGRLTIRAGVEIGEPHRFTDEADALLDNYPYDFVIGSLHWVGDDLILSSDYFEGREIDDAYRSYFDEMLEMVKVSRFDVVGHIDVGKRYGFDAYGEYDIAPYEEAMREIYRALIERGKGIEINQGSLRRMVNEPAPNLTALSWYREEGGEILTLGSDGHKPSDVGFCLSSAIEMAKSAGFSHVTGFSGRNPHPLSLLD